MKMQQTSAPYFEKAIAKGSLLAKSLLGHLYASTNRLAVFPDNEKAFNLLKEAADQGDTLAQYEIGKLSLPSFCFAEQLKDSQIAIKYLEQSAQHGFGPALKELALWQAKNNKSTEAISLFEQANEQGCKLSIDELEQQFSDNFKKA